MTLITRFFEIISPILYGIALAYFFAPMQNFFEYKIFTPLFSKSRKKWIPQFNRVMALILTLVLIVLLIAAAFNIIIPSVVDSAAKLADNLGSYLSNFDENVENYVNRHFAENGFFYKIYTHVKTALGVDADHSLFSKLVEYGTKWILGLFSEENIQRIFSLGSSVFYVLFNIFLAVVFMIYLLWSKERQAARVRKIFNALFKKERVDRIYRAAYMTDERVGQFMRTRIIESILVGIVSFFVYLIMGLPYAPLMALISGVTNIIPYFGPFIGAIPDGLFVLMAAPDKLFGFIVAVLIIQQIDGNVLAPIMQSTTMKIDAFWVLAGLTVMGGVFGLPGMLIGVPVFAVIYVLVREKVETRLKKKGLPTDTGAYEVRHQERKIQRQKPPIVRHYEHIKAKFRKKNKPSDGAPPAEGGEAPDGGVTPDGVKAPDGSKAPDGVKEPDGSETPDGSAAAENAAEANTAVHDEDFLDRAKAFFAKFKKK